MFRAGKFPRQRGEHEIPVAENRRALVRAVGKHHRVAVGRGREGDIANQPPLSRFCEHKAVEVRQEALSAAENKPQRMNPGYPRY